MGKIHFSRPITTEPDDSVWRRMLLALIAFYLLIYAGSFTSERIWDDHVLLNGEAIGGGDSLVHCFNQPFMYNYYRPLVSTAFFLQNRVFNGFTPAYHAVSVLFHLGTVLLVCLIAKDLTKSRFAGLIAGFFFACQPVQVGTSAWLGGFTDTMSNFWSALLVFLLLRCVREQQSRFWSYYSYAVLAFCLAIFTKEQTAVLIVFVPIAIRNFKSLEAKNRVFALSPFLLVLAFFIFAGSKVGFPHPNKVDYSFSARLQLVGLTAWHYLQILIMPGWRSIHSFGFTGMSGGMALKQWIGLVGICGASVCAWLLRKRNAPLSLALLWILVAILPVLNIIPAPFLQLAPYRISLAGMGFSVLIGIIAHGVFWSSAVSSDIRLKNGIAVIAAVWITYLGSLSFLEVNRFRSESTFYKTCVEADPGNLALLQTIAMFHQSHKAPEQSLAPIEKAVQILFPGYWNDLAAIKRQFVPGSSSQNLVRQYQGNHDDPSFWVAKIYTLLGDGYQSVGRLDDAGNMYNISVAFDNSFYFSNIGLGNLAMKRNDNRGAISYYIKAHNLKPKVLDCTRQLAKLLYAEHDFERANILCKEWSNLEPESQECKSMLKSINNEINSKLQP